MDPDEYRRSVERELSATDAETVEIDPSAEEASAALALLGDHEASHGDRSGALRTVGFALRRDPDLFDRLIEVLLDDGLPVAAREAVLRTLQDQAFRLTQMPNKRPGYLNALRSMIEVPDMGLRRKVVGILAREKDEFTQRRLIDGLEGSKPPLVPPSKAIQFLAYDVHPEHIPLLRQLVERPPSRAAKREALRALAADPSSADLLATTLADRSEAADVRRISALGLRSLAPERFEAAALVIAADATEDEQLRAMSITGLGLSDPQPTTATEEIDQLVDDLQSGATGQMKRATEYYRSQRDG